MITEGFVLMYRIDDFRAGGAGVFPIAAGLHIGTGAWVAQRLLHKGMGVSYTVEGTAYDERDGGAFFVHPGEVILQWPGVCHECTEYDGQPLQTIWVELSGSGVPSIARLFGATPARPVLRPADPDEVHRLLNEIVEAFHSPRGYHPGHFLTHVYRVAQLCAVGSDAAGLPAERSPETLPQRARRLLESGMLSFPTVRELAEQLGVSQNTLLTACKQELGMSALDMITQVKLTKAKELLRITDSKLLHIARACGFRSTSHFIRVFSSTEHETPAAWRSARRRDRSQNRP